MLNNVLWRKIFTLGKSRLKGNAEPYTYDRSCNVQTFESAFDDRLNRYFFEKFPGKSRKGEAIGFWRVSK